MPRWSRGNALNKKLDAKGASQKKLPEKGDDLQAEIERQIGPLVGQAQREQIIMRLTAMMSSEKFTGPIAHPRHLRAYEEILPGSAERILQMAERAQNHDHEMDKAIVRASVKDRRRGVYLGFAALFFDRWSNLRWHERKQYPSRNAARRRGTRDRRHVHKGTKQPTIACLGGLLPLIRE